jgi:hypothetical protein
MSSKFIVFYETDDEKYNVIYSNDDEEVHLIEKLKSYYLLQPYKLSLISKNIKLYSVFISFRRNLVYLNRQF